MLNPQIVWPQTARHRQVATPRRRPAPSEAARPAPHHPLLRRRHHLIDRSDNRRRRRSSSRRRQRGRERSNICLREGARRQLAVRRWHMRQHRQTRRLHLHRHAINVANPVRICRPEPKASRHLSITHSRITRRTHGTSHTQQRRHITPHTTTPGSHLLARPLLLLGRAACLLARAGRCARSCCIRCCRISAGTSLGLA